MNEESETKNKWGWWSMDGESFMAALIRANNGEPAEDIYMEFYVNSEQGTEHRE
jgi:hypothetical protein